MDIVETELIENSEISKHSTKKFEWKVENFKAGVDYEVSVGLPEGLTLKFQLRKNQLLNGCKNRHHTQPYYRFVAQKSSDCLVQVFITEVRSGMSFSSPLHKPYQVMSCLSHSPFIRADSLSNYLLDGHLTLAFEVKIQAKYPATGFLKGIKFLKDSKILSDFTYSIGKKVFPVHKTILSARSPVFMKMFSEEFKNKKEGKMSDISSEGFDDFLRFIYVGEVQHLENYARKLLEFADKYEVYDLKTICEKHLLAELTDDDAIEIFQSTHKSLWSNDMKKAAFDRIKSFFTKLNLSLHDNFFEAPEAVNTAILMKRRLEAALEIENSQSEIAKRIKME